MPVSRHLENFFRARMDDGPEFGDVLHRPCCLFAARFHAYAASRRADLASAIHATDLSSGPRLMRPSHDGNHARVPANPVALFRLFLHQQGLDMTTPAGKAMCQMLTFRRVRAQHHPRARPRWPFAAQPRGFVVIVVNDARKLRSGWAHH